MGAGADGAWARTHGRRGACGRRKGGVHVRTVCDWLTVSNAAESPEIEYLDAVENIDSSCMYGIWIVHIYVYISNHIGSESGRDGSSSHLDAGPDGAAGWESLRRNIMIGHRARVLGTAGPPESESG
jgi:hypothetical protein